MENIIFAALLYILVPALLLWLNHESALRSQFVAPQLSTHATTTELPQREIALGNNNSAHSQSDLISSDWRLRSPKGLPRSQSEGLSHCPLGNRTRSNQNANPIQKASKNQALPTIKKHESEDTKVDYHQLTIRQLKKIAQKRKIKRYGNMRKADLILALIT